MAKIARREEGPARFSFGQDFHEIMEEFLHCVGFLLFELKRSLDEAREKAKENYARFYFVISLMRA